MKGTRHNGRSGKNGVYNPLHNDRRFNPEHSEHIDNERVRQNIYWDCYQGYTTMEDQGKENNFSFGGRLVLAVVILRTYPSSLIASHR